MSNQDLKIIYGPDGIKVDKTELTFTADGEIAVQLRSKSGAPLGLPIVVGGQTQERYHQYMPQVVPAPSSGTPTLPPPPPLNWGKCENLTDVAMKRQGFRTRAELEEFIEMANEHHVDLSPSSKEENQSLKFIINQFQGRRRILEGGEEEIQFHDTVVRNTYEGFNVKIAINHEAEQQDEIQYLQNLGHHVRGRIEGLRGGPHQPIRFGITVVMLMVQDTPGKDKDRVHDKAYFRSNAIQ